MAAPAMARASAPLRIAGIASAPEAATWLDLPARLGGEAAGWSVPLLFESRRIFDPGFNTALGEWRIARFLALRGAEPVGRICAALPRDGSTGGIGHFGFLACEEDPATLRALLGAAAAQLAAWGATALRGPFSFSVNHEIGLRVEGGGAPMLRMPRNPAWLPPLLEEAGVPLGLRREKDVLACTLDVAAETHRARFASLQALWPGRDRLRIRPHDPWRLGEEVGLIRTLYNDAWAENWAAQPVTEAEADTMRRLLRPLLASGRVFFAEWEGEPIGLCAVVPNLEEVSHRLGGRLWPSGWLGMAGALAGRTTSARIPLLGIRRAFRRSQVSRMAVGALLSEAIALAERRGWHRLEISWVLEDNAPMLAAMTRLRAPVTGRWRVWHAPLEAAPPA